MRQPLENRDKKFLKSQIQIGWIYGFFTLLVFVSLIVFSVKGMVNINPEAAGFLAVFFTATVVWLLTGDFYKDLKAGIKEVTEKKLEIHHDERKIKKTKVMALVNAWGRSNKKPDKSFLIHIDDATFEVSEDLLKQAEAKGSVKLHYTLYSRKVLKIEA